MEMRDLLEKMMKFAGEKVGQKPGDQWRGTDKAPPGKKLVGDSILKDLSKGKSPKSKEQELSEEFQAFLEAEFQDTVDKRPARKNARPARGHKEEPRYKTIKADEGAMNEKDIELQDYRSMSHKEFQTAYSMTKTEWINNNKALVIKNPSIKKGLGLKEGVAYKAANPHPASKDPIVAQVLKQMRPGLKPGLELNNEAFLYFAYELGKQRARDAWEDYGPAIKYFYQSGIGVNEDANTDNKLAKLLTRFINQNEGADHAVASDAIEYIKKMGHIEQFVTTLDYFGVDLDEDSKEDGPVEARWMVKVSDDEGDHLKTYHRKFPSLSDAKKAYKKYEPYASDFKHKPVKKDQVEEAIDSDIVQGLGQDSFNRAGYNPISDERDYLDKLSELSNLARKPGLNQAMKDQIKQRILDLNAEARKKGFTQVESRGHKILATKLKDVERAKKFASGELKVPTPQERQAQLAKQEPKKEKVDEYGANPPSGTAGQTMADKTGQQNVSPEELKKELALATQVKSVTGATASAPNLLKAMDAVSQGKPAGAQDMKAIEPVLDVVGQAFKDPKSIAMIKNLSNLAKQNQPKF
jgi:hypothetical protein